MTRALILGLAALLAISGLSVPTTAWAADNTLQLRLPQGDSSHNGQPVYERGRSYSFAIGYGTMDDGYTADLVVPEGLTLPGAVGDELPIPGGNSAVEKIVRTATGLRIHFVQDWPEDISQGSLEFEVEVGETPPTSQVVEQEWSLDGGKTSTTVVLKQPGDVFANPSNSHQKALTGWPDLSRHLSVSAQGVVSLDPAITELSIPYRITVDTKDAKTISITDTLGAGLILDPDSFSAELTTWDADGLNRTKTPVDPITGSGASFTGSVDLPAASSYTLTYTASVDPGQLAALTADLQARYDAVKDAPGGGPYAVSLKNAAVVGGTPLPAVSIDIAGQAAGVSLPNLGQAFGKSAPHSITVTPGEDGSLEPGVALDYTLTADLRPFDGSNEFKTLTSDVVITDTLPTQATWLSGADAITATVDGVALALTLKPGATDPFSYDILGQTLVVNVGKQAKHYVISAKATATTVTGLSAGQAPIAGATAHQLPNSASFAYGEGLSQNRSATTTLLDLGDTSGGVDSPNDFSKRGRSGEVKVSATETTWIPFDFVVAEGAANIAESRIVDLVDTDVFDLSDLAAIKSRITGTYNWWLPISGDSFDLALSEGALVLTPSASFAAAWGPEHQATPWNKRLALTLSLPLKPVKGKQSLAITNGARLEGATRDEIVFVSEAHASATSFGDELELRKSIYDETAKAWTSNLRVALDESGKLVHDTFIYRATIFPHGSFASLIKDIEDPLPDGVEFVGFVKNANIADGTIEPGDSFTVEGSLLRATYDVTDRRLTVARGSITRATPITLNFKVRVTSFTPDLGITNVIDRAKATITPTNGYPIDITKADADSETAVLHGGRFKVLDEAGDLVSYNGSPLDSLTAVAGKLRNGSGQDATAVLVPAPGRYQVVETTAPSGYTIGDPIWVTVASTGLSDTATLYNTKSTTPLTPSVSVGDLVWFDADGDGLQGSEDDVPLAGAVLTLVGPDGKAVTGIDGLPVGERTTGADGRYLFEGLPVLPLGQSYTVRVTPPAGYVATKAGAGADRGADSSTDEASTSADLSSDGAQDLTLDFGFVRAPEPVKTYGIGDIVWIDTDKDGRQGGAEAPLPGVTVRLLDADGNPVPGVDPQVTDAQGRYLFDALPEGTYRVSFTLTEAQRQQYTFTESDRGPDDAGDSDADPATGVTAVITLGPSNTHLDKEYDSRPFTASEGIDPTWDAGVILKAAEPTEEPTSEPTPTPPTTEPTIGPTEPTVEPTEEPTFEPTPTPPTTEPTEPKKPAAVDTSDDKLPFTGADAAPLAVLAALMLAGGTVALAWRRRQ